MLKKIAMGIAPYGKPDKKEQDRSQEKHDPDTDGSTHSTSSVGSANSRASSSASVASTLASPHRASKKGSVGMAEYPFESGKRGPDEESILNGWVRRYFALQPQVVLPARLPSATSTPCIPERD